MKLKLVPLNHNSNNNINSIIEREKENILMNNKENNKQDLNILQNKSKSNSNVMNSKNKVDNNSSNNLISNRNMNNKENNLLINNKIMLKKDEIYYINVISKQKEDLRKLLLKNNKRFNYVSNNKMNISPVKDLNHIFMPNLNNKSVPKKMSIDYKLLKNKYYIHSPPYLKGYEKYPKNGNKLEYVYGKNVYNYNPNNININNILHHKEILPKVPRRLSPIKKSI